MASSTLNSRQLKYATGVFVHPDLTVINPIENNNATVESVVGDLLRNIMKKAQTTLALDTPIDPYTLDIKYQPSGIPQESKVSELPENAELYTMFTPKAAVGSPLAIKNQNLAQAEGDNMKLREINSFMLTNRKGGKDSEEMVVSRKDYEECHQSIRDLRKGNVWLGGRVQRLDESYQRSEVAMRELRKMVGQSEEANRELRKVAGQSEERYIKSEKRWEERHARSEEAIRELRKTNQRLDESNLELKKTLRDVRAEVIEERASREKSEQEIRRYLRLITPLHLRALLDKARQKILMDVEGGTSWESYRRGRDVDTFSKDILEELSVKYHPPSSEAVHFLCYASKEIRKRGNEAAHKADVSDIRKALMDEQLDAGDVGDHERLLLKELFEFAYGQAI